MAQASHENELKPAEVTRFVPTAIETQPATPTTRADFEEIDLQNGALTLKLCWPASATSEPGTWLRELLR